MRLAIWTRVFQSKWRAIDVSCFLLAEEHREAFDTAFAAMAAELPQVRKDGTVELVEGGKKLGIVKFARWEDMDRVLRPIMGRYGFAFTFTTVPGDSGKLLIRGELVRQGYSCVAEIPLPPDDLADPETAFDGLGMGINVILC